MLEIQRYENKLTHLFLNQKFFNAYITPVDHVVVLNLGDNCLQNCNLGREIVGFMVGNFVLQRHISRAVKQNLRP